MNTRSKARSKENDELPKVGTKRRRTANPEPKTKVVAVPASRQKKKTPPQKTEKKVSKTSVKQALSKAKEKQTVKDETIKAEQLAPITSELKTVNKDVVNNVRRRELRLKLEKENSTKEKLHTKSLLCRMPDICNHLRSYYR